MVNTSNQNADVPIHIRRVEARPREAAVSAGAFDLASGSNSGVFTTVTTDRNDLGKCREFQPESNGSKMPFGAPGWKSVLDRNAERWFPSRRPTQPPRPTLMNGGNSR